MAHESEPNPPHRRGRARNAPWTFWFNLTLRAPLELAVVASLAFWGYQAGGQTAWKLLLGVVAPVIGFGLWGTVDFRSVPRWSEALRLTEELLISGLAAAGLFAVDHPALGWALAALTVIYHVSVYATGHRLLEKASPPGGEVDHSQRQTDDVVSH